MTRPKLVIHLPEVMPMQQGSKTNVPTGPECRLCKRRPTRLVDGADMRTKGTGEVQRLSKYKALVAFHAKMAANRANWAKLDGGVGLLIEFRYPRPKDHLTTKGVLSKGKPFHKISPPDLDKLLRAIGDALTAAGNVWTDDARVVSTTIRKRYAGALEVHGLILAVVDEELDQVEAHHLALGWRQ